MRRKRLLNNLSLKLGLILLGVVSVALGVVYVAVVPRLESSLVDAKLDQLRKAAPALRFQILVGAGLGSPFTLRERLDLAEAENNARVAVLQRLGERSIVSFADSMEASSKDLDRDPIALRALEDRMLASGRVERNGQKFGEVAIPIDASYVLLLSASLDDALDNVALIRRSVLIAGGIAFGISLFAGSMAALRLTRRIRRLEAAAERIAGGDFAVPVDDAGHDEVAQLARSFDRMRRQLARLDDARRAFIANASHELRTPLFSLAGFLELIDDEELDESTRRDFVRSAREQVERLTRLATDLLDLSRLDAGQLAVESGPVDLGESARALVEEFQAVAEGSGHELRLSTASDIVAVGDEQHVLRIGRALVENALRHTPAGSAIEVRVGARNGHAKLEVSDNGPGIAPNAQERLFERFYRGDGGAAFGSGLGLAIARELAVRMAGSIELRSQSGETTFTLVLPLARSAVSFSRENATI